LLLTPLKILHVRLQLLLLAAEFLPPNEMDSNGGGNRNDG
jgi:hypothetical protein